MVLNWPIFSLTFLIHVFLYAGVIVELRLNDPLFNENLNITNGILCPSNVKIYEKNLDITNPVDLTNEFGRSPATSLNRGCTVTAFLLPLDGMLVHCRVTLCSV